MEASKEGEQEQQLQRKQEGDGERRRALPQGIREYERGESELGLAAVLLEPVHGSLILLRDRMESTWRFVCGWKKGLEDPLKGEGMKGLGCERVLGVCPAAVGGKAAADEEKEAGAEGERDGGLGGSLGRTFGRS